MSTACNNNSKSKAKDDAMSKEEAEIFAKLIDLLNKRIEEQERKLWILEQIIKR